MAGVIDQLPHTGKPLRIDRAGISTPPGTWLLARNVRFNEDMSVERRPGFYSFHRDVHETSDQALYQKFPSPGHDVLELRGLHEFVRLRRPGNSSRVFLAHYDDYLIGSHDGINFPMPLASGLGHDAVLDFREFRNLERQETTLIVMSSDRGWHPSYWHGRYDSHTDAWDRDPWTYFKQISTMPYASFGMVHNQRLWASGGVNPYRVFYSAAGDYMNFDGGGYFDLEVKHGAVTAFFPTYYGVLLIGQEEAISRIYFDELGDPIRIELLTDETGPVNNRSVVRVGNDFLFLTTRDQVISLATTERYGDLLFAATSLSVYRQFEKRQRAANLQCFAVNDPEDRIAWFGMSRGGGYRNDVLMGYDYNKQLWLEDNNRGIGGFSCGSIWTLSHFNMKPKVVFGSYSNQWWYYYADPPSTPINPGRMWFYRRDHKEDVFLAPGGMTEADDDTCPAHLQGIVVTPEIGMNPATGWNLGTFWCQGTYAGGAAPTTIRLRCRITGVINGGPGLGATVDWEDIGAATTGSFGTDTWANGTSVWLTWPDLYLYQNAAAGETLYEGDELWILVERGRRLTTVFRSDLRDVWNGLRWNAQGDGISYNFLPELETADFKLGVGDRSALLKGITVYTRAVGSMADLQEYVQGAWQQMDPDFTNEYRNFLDLYLQADNDREWQHLAMLDGNSAQRYHIDVSHSEVTQDYIGRATGDTLVLALVPNDAEATSDPLAKIEDINYEYIAIERNVKTVRFRFDQATMSSKELDTTVHNFLGSHSGNFCLVGFQLHFEAAPRDMKAMGQGSMTVTLPLEGV